MTAELQDRLRGRLKVTEPKITEVVERLVAIGSPRQVIAFGLRARGDADADSDLDIVVVLDRVDSAKTACVGSWLLKDVDLLVTDKDRFEKFRQYRSSVHFYIHTGGVVLYDRTRDDGPNRDAIAKISRR